MRESKDTIIINAAIKIFAEKGFHNATINEIADEAHVASGLIYSYFKNKLDLLLTITIRFWECLNKSSENEVLKSQSPNKKIEEILNVLEDLLFKEKNSLYLAKVLTEALPNIFLIKEEQLQEKRKAITNENRKFITNLDRIIEEGQRQGIFSNSLKACVMRQVIYGGVEMVLYGLFLKALRDDPVGYDIIDAKQAIQRLIEAFLGR